MLDQSRECHFTMGVKMNTFLKTVISVFLLAVIVLVSASSSHAISVVNHLITDDPKANSGCATPTVKNVFSTTDNRVYSWVFVSQAFPIDTLTWKWIAPDNWLYASFPWTVGIAGSGCGASWIAIKDQPAANKTGLWKAEIYNGNTLVASDTFTIQNPSPPTCTYTFSDWGPCQPSGTQERTIISSSPAGCIEWVPQLTQACTYVPPALTAPKNLRYTFSNNILTINWDSVTGATGYKLGLGTKSGKYDTYDLGNIVQIGPADVSTWAPGTYTFYLAVKSYAGSQESSFSNEVFLSMTIAGPSFAAPNNLRYSTQGNMMTIIWDAVSGADGYKVGLGVQSGSYLGPYDLGKATQIGPFAAASVASGTYYLAAKAYKDSNESAYSNEIVINLMPPVYTLSGDQKNLILKSGNPQYLCIVFNSDPERREETWTYAALGKMYLFWDGVKVGEQSIAIDPTLYANPPSVDPSLFAKKTKPYDVIRIFGNDYTVTDASSLDPELAALDFKTYYFMGAGVFASFIGEEMVVVQTNDIAGRGAARIGQMGQKPAAREKSGAVVHLEQEAVKFTPLQLVTLAIFLGAKSNGYIFSDNPDASFAFDCALKCVSQNIDCMNAIRNLKDLFGTQTEELGSKGLYIMLDAAELIDKADTTCNASAKMLIPAIDSVELSETGNNAVINCPIDQCTSYTYSDWSACQPTGTRTRTVVSKSPAGCTGDPAPNLLTESCTYIQPCTAYIYSDSKCIPNGNGLGTITRTYKGIPEGCSGNVPPPVYFCCDGLDPC